MVSFVKALQFLIYVSALSKDNIADISDNNHSFVCLVIVKYNTCLNLKIVQIKCG